jgi:hypothetical protein
MLFSLLSDLALQGMIFAKNTRRPKKPEKQLAFPTTP